MFFLSVSVSFDKYRYKINQWGEKKKVEVKPCSARSLGYISGELSQCDSVQNPQEGSGSFSK